MSYKLNRYIWPETGAGEFWHGEKIEEHVALVHYETILTTVLSYLPKKGKILEAGCGLGKWLIYLHQHDYDVIGMDTSKDALSLINNFDKSIPLILGNVEHTDFPNESFEAITSFGVVEHNESGPEESLRESYRLLKKDGILLITVPYQNFIRRIVFGPLFWIIGKILKRLGFQPQFSEYRFSKKCMTTKLEKVGFKVLKVEPVDYIYPKSMGLYADWGTIIGDSHKRWELNRFGKIVQRFLSIFPLWTYCAGILLICTKQ